MRDVPGNCVLLFDPQKQVEFSQRQQQFKQDRERRAQLEAEVEKKLPTIYKDYEDLDKSKKRSLAGLVVDAETEAMKLAQKKGLSSLAQLSVEDLKQLDLHWNKRLAFLELSPDDFYSPFSNTILKMEIVKLQKIPGSERSNAQNNELEWRYKKLEERGVTDFSGAEERRKVRQENQRKNAENYVKITGEAANFVSDVAETSNGTGSGDFVDFGGQFL
jgi:hypothetical protein